MVSAVFKAWLKANTNIKLSSDAAVLRITKEGITGWDSLVDFDKKSIERLPAICKDTIPAIAVDVANGIAAEQEVPGANISSIATRRLITAVHAAEYYTSIGRTMNSISMHYTNVLKDFKIEWDTYQDLRDQDEPDVPLVVDKDGDRRIIKWVPIFLDCLTRSYGIRGPLVYVLRDEPDVPAEDEDPLMNNQYYGVSGSLHEELIARLEHSGAIFKNDNTSVFLKIEKATRGTTVESTVKAFSRRKDGRGAFQALVANHAGDTKYRAILKKRMNLLQTIKWNGRSYPLETHVSNHRQSVDELRECSTHITVAVPNDSQRVEYLIDSISNADTTLQAAIGLIRANTNNMRNDFESAASALIEVDPYRRSQRPGAKTANVSAIDFSAGRGTTGVDLRWHPKKDFKDLPDDQRDELVQWMRTNDGRKAMKDSRNKTMSKKRKNEDGDKRDKGKKENWKKRFKKALKTPHGIKSVMSLLAEEEKTNTAFVSALQVSFPPASNTLPPPPPTLPVAPPAAATVASATSQTLATALPATAIRLNSILNRR